MNHISRRATLTIADQGINSFSNFIVSVVVARNLSADDFGAFSLALATCLIVITLCRAFTGDVLLIRYSGIRGTDTYQSAGRALGAAFAVGVMTAAGLMLAAFLIQGTVGANLSCLAIVLPALLMFDTWRHAMFAGGEPGRALVGDVLWLAIQVLGFVLLSRANGARAGFYLVTWGLAAGAALLIMLLSRRQRVMFTIREWILDHRSTSFPLGADYATSLLANYVTLLVLAAVASLDQVAALRAASLALGPVYVFSQGLSAVAVPEGVRLRAEGERRLLRMIVLLVGLQLSVLAAWTACVLLVPEAWGRELLGASFSLGRPIVPLMALQMACGAAALGATWGLRVHDATQRIFRARLFVAPLSVALGAAGAIVDGAVGAAVGLTVGVLVSAIAWWFQYAASRAMANTVPEPL